MVAGSAVLGVGNQTSISPTCSGSSPPSAGPEQTTSAPGAGWRAEVDLEVRILARVTAPGRAIRIERTERKRNEVHLGEGGKVLRGRPRSPRRGEVPRGRRRGRVRRGRRGPPVPARQVPPGPAAGVLAYAIHQVRELVHEGALHEQRLCAGQGVGIELAGRRAVRRQPLPKPAQVQHDPPLAADSTEQVPTPVPEAGGVLERHGEALRGEPEGVRQPRNQGLDRVQRLGAPSLCTVEGPAGVGHHVRFEIQLRGARHRSQQQPPNPDHGAHDGGTSEARWASTAARWSL